MAHLSTLPRRLDPRGERLAPLHAIAFLSGASALIQEVVYGRLLARSFGLTTEAAAAAAAIFLGGIALGAAASRGWTLRRPLRAMAWLEGTIAAFAYASPLLFLGFDTLQGMMRDAAGAPRAAGVLLACPLAAVLLAVPTLAMGATFPALLAAMRSRLGAADARRANLAGAIATIYGANTTGAVAGTLAAGFLLLPWLGVIGAVHAAGGISVLAAWSSWILDARTHPSSRPAGAGGDAISVDPAAAPKGPGGPGGKTPPRDGTPPRLLAAVALLGAGMLALEILWTRLLIHLLGASTYAFTLVLAAVLLGTGLGAYLLGPVRAGHRLSQSPRDRFALLAMLAALAAPLGVALLRVVAGVPSVFEGLQLRIVAGESFPALALREGLLAVAAIAPPFVFSGAALPVAIHAACADRADRVPRRGAALYASNTAGAVLGGPAAAFLLLPFLGPAWSFLAATAAVLLAGVLALSRPASLPARIAVAAAGMILATGLVLSDRSPGPADPRVLFERHGVAASVRVEEFPLEGGGRARNLRVNGKVVAGTELLDRRLQVLMGFLPAAVHPRPRRALVVGLGTGLTAGALALAQGIEHIDIVEIAPEVVEAAPWFAGDNGGVLKDPRVHLIVDDARQWVRFAGGLYDIVTSDPIHPWVAGSGSLYTVEYYRLVAQRLRAGGLVAQWVPLYQLDREDVRCILGTFGEVFPYRSLWFTGTDLVMLGGSSPPAIDPRRLERLLRDDRARECLGEAALDSPERLLATLVAGEDEAAGLAGKDAAIHRDLRPILEFRAGRNLGRGYAIPLMRELLAAAPDPSRLLAPPPPGTPRRDPARLARVVKATRDAALRFLSDLSHLPAGQARAAFARALEEIPR